MSPRFTSLLISVFASSTVLLTSTAQAAPKKTKADAAKEQAAKEQAAKEQADKEQAEKERAEQAEKEQAEKEQADKAEAEKAQAEKDAAAKEKADKEAAAVAEAEAGSSPVETAGTTYYNVGLRYRGIIVPKFMMNLFGDGGRTIVAHGFGPEFAIRKNAFEYNLSIWYAGYGMDDTPFKGKNDDAKAWEIVNSKLKVLFITADFLWSQDFTPEFALNYGLAGGFGFVFGDLYRTQAMPGPNADVNTGDGFVKCAGQLQGDPNYCGNDNNHYNGYTENSWANGGSKPILFPWFVLQTGLRYKPHRNFVARLDAGFGTSGFFLGLGLDYGL